MSKSTGKTPSKPDIKRPATTDVVDENDFSGSMARLAELAAAGLTPEKQKSEERDLEQEALNQYLTPKRKKKGTSGDQKEEESNPGTIKFRINPYVVSGMLVVVLSLGVLAIPKIVKFIYTEEKVALVDEKKLAAQQSAKEEAQTKNYTVGEAIRDVTRKGELRTSSVEDLAKQVAETNIELGLPEDGGGIFGLFQHEEAPEVATEEITRESEGETGAYQEGSDPEVENGPSSDAPTNLPEFSDLNTELSALPSFSTRSSTCYSGQEILTEQTNDRLFWDLFRTVKSPNWCTAL